MIMKRITKNSFNNRDNDHNNSYRTSARDGSVIGHSAIKPAIEQISLINRFP